MPQTGQIVSSTGEEAPFTMVQSGAKSMMRDSVGTVLQGAPLLSTRALRELDNPVLRGTIDGLNADNMLMHSSRGVQMPGVALPQDVQFVAGAAQQVSGGQCGSAGAKAGAQAPIGITDPKVAEAALDAASSNAVWYATVVMSSCPHCKNFKNKMAPHADKFVFLESTMMNTLAG